MLDRILDIAERLALELTADIPLAKDRQEHIRITARANHATELLNEIRAAKAN